jgi:hypothetical protein
MVILHSTETVKNGFPAQRLFKIDILQSSYLNQSTAYDLDLGNWGLFYILRGLGPYNSNKLFQRLNDFTCGVIRKCGIRYKITLQRCPTLRYHYRCSVVSLQLL